MKSKFLVIALLAMTFVGVLDATAQKKEREIRAFEVELGGGIASPTEKLNFDKNHLGWTAVAELRYNFKNLPLDLGIHVDGAVLNRKNEPIEGVQELKEAKFASINGLAVADLNMFRKLKLDPEVPEDFLMVYSGLDNFDIAYKWGIDKCLDGMPACTPVNSGKLFAAMENNDYDKAAEYLNNIIDLRDFFVARDLWPSFSTAMNMLGYEGNFAPDYISSIQEKYIPEIREELIRIGEL